MGEPLRGLGKLEVDHQPDVTTSMPRAATLVATSTSVSPGAEGTDGAVAGVLREVALQLAGGVTRARRSRASFLAPCLVRWKTIAGPRALAAQEPQSASILLHLVDAGSAPCSSGGSCSLHDANPGGGGEVLGRSCVCTQSGMVAEASTVWRARAAPRGTSR